MPNIYTLTDTDGIVKLVTPFEATADAGVTADSTLTKNTETSLEEFVSPNEAKKVGDNYVLIERDGLFFLNDALKGYLDQENMWRTQMTPFNDAITVPGFNALDSAGQGAVHYAQDTTYSLETREKGLRNLALGTLDGINSPLAFSQAIDGLPSDTVTALNNLTMMFLWIDRSTGEQITMANALNPTAQWGTLEAVFKPYLRPTVTA